VWSLIESVTVAGFTLEYFIRLWSVRHRFKFFISFFSLCDLVAIIPFYVRYLGNIDPEGSFEEVYRLSRVLRLVQGLRLMDRRHNKYVGIITTSIGKSSDAMGLLLFLLSLVAIICSSLMYYVEKGVLDKATGQYLRSDGSESPFTSIPATWYWAVVTMTTVGYGDVFPVETGGQVVAGITAIAGILIIAMPITILGTNFQDTFYLRNHRAPSNEEEKHGDPLIKQHIHAIRYHRKQLDKSLNGVRSCLQNRAGETEFKSAWTTIETVIVSGLFRVEKFLMLLNDHRLPERHMTLNELHEMMDEYDRVDMSMEVASEMKEFKAMMKRLQKDEATTTVIRAMSRKMGFGSKERVSTI